MRYTTLSSTAQNLHAVKEVDIVPTPKKQQEQGVTDSQQFAAALPVQGEIWLYV